MPTGTLTISSYTANPPQQVDVNSLLEVRGWYTRDYISVDGVTPIFGNDTNGEQGPYYSTTPIFNSDSEIVVPAHVVQITVGANPTANYFEGLWIDGAFVMLLMPNTQGATGWQIPSIYGDPIAYDEIATYNRARRLVYAPDSYFTADQVIQEILRLSGNFDYMAVGVNGIGQASFPPVVASAPIVLTANDPRVGSWYNILSYGAATTNTAAQNAAAIVAANTAAAGTGGGIYWPVGFFPTNSVTITVPVMFAPGLSGPRVANGQTVTFTKAITADNSKHFDNAFAGGGSISFSGNTDGVELNVLWWKANSIQGTTDMTEAIQAALTASGGRLNIYLPTGSYLITNTLTLLNSGAGFSPVVFYGDGPFQSCIVNKASANKPSLSIVLGLVQVEGIGFWGDINFPNDGIKAIGGPSTYPSRLRINNCLMWAQGNGVFLESLHSVWITNCYGVVSSGSGIYPAGLTDPAVPTTGTMSFIYVNQPVGGFLFHLIITDNMNESYAYQVYTSGISTGTGYSSWTITGNQFEGSVNGLKLDYISMLNTSGNYLAEGSTGYAIDCNECSGGTVGPDEVHFTSVDAVSNTIRLNNCSSLTVDAGGTTTTETPPRLYITGTSVGLVYLGDILRLEDESSDHQLSMINVKSPVDVGGVPKNALNMQTGSSTWYANDPTAIVTYPTARLNDRILKTTVAAGQSFGWYCTTASSAGSLVQTVGAGPSPVLLADYGFPIAYDYKIVMASATTYNVFWKTQGGGVYALLNSSPLAISALAHLVIDQVGGGAPGSSITLRWPTNTYVNGNTWTITNVTAAVWSVINPALKGIVGINPLSVGANSISVQTFVFTGALAGDALTLNIPTLTSGLYVMGTPFVSGTDQITITFENRTGSPIDQAQVDCPFTLSR